MKKLTVMEETVLLAIFRLKEKAYSVTIHRMILEMTGRDIIMGTLFNTLKQLYQKGYLLKSKDKPKQGVKSIILYTVSKEGLRALEQTRSMHDQIWAEIPKVLTHGKEK